MSYFVNIYNIDEYNWWLKNSEDLPVEVFYNVVLFPGEAKPAYWNKWIKIKNRFYNYRSKNKMESNRFIKYVGMLYTDDEDLLNVLMKSGYYLHENVNEHLGDKGVRYQIFKNDKSVKITNSLVEGGNN